MVKARTAPCDRGMAGVAFGGGYDMSHALAARTYAVMATGARSDDICVIHSDGWTPCRCGMACGAFAG